MALNTTQSAGLSVEMKTYYDRRLLRRATATLLFDKFAQKRDIPRGAGKTIEFRKFSALALPSTSLTEGVPPPLKSLEVTSITATVVQEGDAIGFSDLVSTTTLDPILDETTDLLAQQSAELIDERIRDIVVAGTTVQYASTAVSRVTVAAGMVFNVAELREAILTLTLNRARPINGEWNAIIHPRTAYSLQGTSEWISANQYAGSDRIFDGSLGKLYGVRFWQSDKAPVFTAAGAAGIDVYGTMIFGADAYGIVNLGGHNLQTIYKPLGSAGTADPLNQQQTMGWKCTFTTKILDQSWMVRVEHAAV